MPVPAVLWSLHEKTCQSSRA